MPVSRWTRLFRRPSARATPRRRSARPCLEALEDRLAPADLTLLKSGPASVAAGNNVTYNLTVINTTATVATNVMITDTVPAGLTLIGHMPTPGNTDMFADATPPGSNTASFIGSVSAGATDRFQLIATASPTLLNGTQLANTARYTDTATPGGLNSNTVTTVVAPAGVALTKSGPGTVAAGSAVTYSLTFSNTTSSAVSTVTLTDSLPPGLTLTSNTAVSNPDAFTASKSGNTATFTAAIVAAGSIDTFQIVSMASGTLANGSTLSNTATFTSNSGNGSSNTVTTTVAPAGVSLTKAGPATVAAGGQVTYTLTFSNTTATNATGASLTDTMPTGLTLNSEMAVSGPDIATFTNTSAGNTASFSGGTVSANSTDTFQIIATVGAVANGTLLNNTASFTTATLGNGTSNTVTTTVNNMVTINLISPATVTFSPAAQSFTVTATLTAGATPTGTVTFTVAGLPVGATAPVTNGTASAVLTLPPSVSVGSYPITAAFTPSPGSPLLAVSTTNPFSVVPSPTVVNITAVSDKFSLFGQTETVTAQVQGSGGLPVTSGMVTLVDAGQTQTVTVSNGLATATFSFSFFEELTTALAHLLSASFSPSNGNYLSSPNITFQAPGNTQGLLNQLTLDALFLALFTGGSTSGGSGNTEAN
jgi:uncharacterized repeat protein (TIGR01451 family)